MLNLTVPPDAIDPSTVPDHVQEDLRSDKSTGLNAAANENKRDWKSAASSAAKLLLRGVRDSADAFGPLKSAAGGLCFILENWEVRPTSPISCPPCSQASQQMKANTQTIESLAPRVKTLSELLCESSPEGDIKEGARRKKLER